MKRATINRLERLEAQHAAPNHGAKLGIIEYADGRTETIYTDKEGALSTTKSLCELMGAGGDNPAVRVVEITQDGENNSLFSVLAQMLNYKN